MLGIIFVLRINAYFLYKSLRIFNSEMSYKHIVENIVLLNIYLFIDSTNVYTISKSKNILRILEISK